MDFRIVNDIIILGNGFDLAHGLATGYKDYVKEMIIDSSRLLNPAPRYRNSPFRLKDYPTTFNYEESPVGPYLYNQKDRNELAQLYLRVAAYNRRMPSDFIKRIIEDFGDKGWVDLEDAYFSFLPKITPQGKHDKKDVKALNEEMKRLGESLCQYLNTLERPAPSEDIRTLFEQIKKEQIERAWKQAWAHNYRSSIAVTRVHAGQMEERLSGITVLTFNYTDTCEVLYKDALTIKVKDASNCSLVGELKDDIPPTFIHIHGSLKEEDILLGYGDETTDMFRELEDANDNELTKYFKSFYYMQNPRYRQFFEVLERGPFRLHLMGHSCGLSDRVLLSSIFNHPNLEDVRIYYHDRGEDGNDYFQLCQNISRHFHDKHAMRLKILPFKGKMLPDKREDTNMMSVPLIPHKTS